MKNTSAAASGDTGSLQPPHNEMLLFPLLVGTNANHARGLPYCTSRHDSRRRYGSYDIILMDTDNGPDHTVRGTNVSIHAVSGLKSAWWSLRPGGIAVFWSATISDEFEDRFDRLPWQWRRDDIRLDSGRADAFHYMYLADASLENFWPHLGKTDDRPQLLLDGVG